MPSLSGAIGAGLQGYLSGSIATKEKYRQEEIARSKEDLKNYMDLVKEGWTPIDESRGASEGAVLKIRGHGYLSAPKVDKAAIHEMQLRILGLQERTVKAEAELKEGELADRAPARAAEAGRNALRREEMELIRTKAKLELEIKQGEVAETPARRAHDVASRELDMRLWNVKERLAQIELQKAQLGKADQLVDVLIPKEDGTWLTARMTQGDYTKRLAAGEFPAGTELGEFAVSPKDVDERASAHILRLSQLEVAINTESGATRDAAINEWNTRQPPNSIEAYVFVDKTWPRGNVVSKFKLPILLINNVPIQLTMAMARKLAGNKMTMDTMIKHLYKESQEQEVQAELARRLQEYEQKIQTNVTK